MLICNVGEICGSHSDAYEDYCLLESGTIVRRKTLQLEIECFFETR